METINKENDQEIKKLEECKKQCEEYLNNWKRAAADLINYKKEELERINLFGQYTKENIILKILPILDNIELAEKKMPGNWKENDWFKGFLQIKNQLQNFLKKEGVQEIETLNKKFDPNLMEVIEEAVSSVKENVKEKEEKNAESGSVMEELQKGYMMNGKVLRPAKVKILK